MNPQRPWHTLSPQEQQAAWAAHFAQQAAMEQAARRPAVNVAAIIAAVCAVLGALMLPIGFPLGMIVFGPIALICGIVGEQVATRTGAPGRAWSAIALVAGLLESGAIVLALL